MKTIILSLVFLVTPTCIKAIEFYSKESTLNKVCTALASTFDKKSAPVLKLISRNSGETVIATYFAHPTPTIKIDEALFDLCMGMGADSLNALSIIIGHELAHYYMDHNWCSDFAFATRKTAIGKQMDSISRFEKMSHEMEADNLGLYHSCMAGYKPFGIYNKLLGNIYTAYRLPNRMEGYPSKEEREVICRQAQTRIKTLFEDFKSGIAAIKNGNYSKAINCFNNINIYFPSRENYYDLGTAKTLWVIELKPADPKAALYPGVFYYPVKTDTISRMESAAEIRLGSGLPHADSVKMKVLLDEARENFLTALSLDRSYEKAHFNLACVYDLLGNPEAAIGEIKMLPLAMQNTKDAYTMMGISYSHEDNDAKAREMFGKARGVGNK